MVTFQVNSPLPTNSCASLPLRSSLQNELLQEVWHCPRDTHPLITNIKSQKVLAFQSHGAQLSSHVAGRAQGVQLFPAGRSGDVVRSV